MLFRPSNRRCLLKILRKPLSGLMRSKRGSSGCSVKIGPVCARLASRVKVMPATANGSTSPRQSLTNTRRRASGSPDGAATNSAVAPRHRRSHTDFPDRSSASNSARIRAKELTSMLRCTSPRLRDSSNLKGVACSVRSCSWSCIYLPRYVGPVVERRVEERREYGRRKPDRDCETCKPQHDLQGKAHDEHVELRHAARKHCHGEIGQKERAHHRRRQHQSIAEHHAALRQRRSPVDSLRGTPRRKRLNGGGERADEHVMAVHGEKQTDGSHSKQRR